jgi:hypothetical protein
MEKIVDISLLFLKSCTVKYCKANFHFGPGETIFRKIDLMEDILTNIQIAHMRAGIEYLRLGLQGYKVKKELSECVKDKFKNSYDLSIRAFDMLVNPNPDDKVLVTKIIIIASMYLYFDDVDWMKISIRLALERLMEIAKIKNTFRDKFSDSWTFWKTYRDNFVHDIQNLILGANLLLSRANKDTIKDHEFVSRENASRKNLSQDIKTDILASIPCISLNKMYSFHSLFKEEIFQTIHCTAFAYIDKKLIVAKRDNMHPLFMCQYNYSCVNTTI